MKGGRIILQIIAIKYSEMHIEICISDSVSNNQSDVNAYHIKLQKDVVIWKYCKWENGAQETRKLGYIQYT